MVKEVSDSAFNGAWVRYVMFSSALRFLGDGAFRECRELEHAVFRGRGRLKEIGSKCFYESGL